MKKNILFVLICWLGSVNCGGWGSDNSKRVRLQDVQASFQGGRGVNEGGRLGRAPRPAFYTLAKDMSLNRGATHFTLGPRPPPQIYPDRPLFISCFMTVG